jgi:hypothetical protein
MQWFTILENSGGSTFVKDAGFTALNDADGEGGAM